jgi:hypothetical protein
MTGTPQVRPRPARRPPAATAAAVLGVVTAVPTALLAAFFLLLVLGGAPTLLHVSLALGGPCALGLVLGSMRLIGGRSPALLFGSAVACVVVLLVALASAVAVWDGSDVASGIVFVALALVLPTTTAVLAWLPAVRRWAVGRR